MSEGLHKSKSKEETVTSDSKELNITTLTAVLEKQLSTVLSSLRALSFLSADQTKAHSGEDTVC